MTCLNCTCNCYLQGIRSYRQLEAELSRNTEFTWLLRGLLPDHRTYDWYLKEEACAFLRKLENVTWLLFQRRALERGIWCGKRY
ncbi:MAG: transposase [Firmicutes bacterium]|nr:transposase [Dethiobacter sp.]MBS3887777.1 transposase [Bacillota bacterium]MBS4054875.1 transposase [Thermaerobacter sp.]